MPSRPLLYNSVIQGGFGLGGIQYNHVIQRGSFTSLFNHVPWDKSQTWSSDHLVFHFHQPAAQCHFFPQLLLPQFLWSKRSRLLLVCLFTSQIATPPSQLTSQLLSP
ncbi:predicted protein [Histoplasma capsulatum G186AR]|uniref:Uncharacterized protein n=1 Tax=Ajellomyces capsulatus (strain G186AR / H82 / ATCC MYA-2454 / RMSCC 2432) TaxID=447093 RepID=C0NIX6_AJECG|nr:uncharacterized protein HCBG_03106 [Histoplasma capsulatum G186AR]EEH07817.1 predicted protein [Histoplasma capsulatum G186AR]